MLQSSPEPRFNSDILALVMCAGYTGQDLLVKVVPIKTPNTINDYGLSATTKKKNDRHFRHLFDEPFSL